MGYVTLPEFFNLYKVRELRIYSDVTCSDFINVLAILTIEHLSEQII